MSNKTLSGTESKKKLVEGVVIVNDVVSSTLGPSGRNVILENEDGTIRITKDGVTVANAIKSISDPISNLGIQLIKQVANKSADKAGDGTTTSTLLATVLVQEGIKRIDQGHNAVEVKKGIDKAVKVVVDTLRSISKEISDDAQIKQVATLSANNDSEIGVLIATALDKAGPDGIVTIEESKTGETYLETVEGMSLDRGFRSPYFVTDNNTMQAILEEPYILIYDGILRSANQILQVFNYVAMNNKSLLIIAEDIDGEALGTLIVNKAQDRIKACAVKAPQFGDKRTHILHDIAILTNGEVISEKLGHKIDKLTAAQFGPLLGTTRLATISKDTTTIIDGKGDVDKIRIRLEEIKAQIDKATSNYETEQLQERLAKMVGGVSIIHVGALSEVELKERKDRVEDALHATRAAVEEGIVPGGGMALINCISSLDSLFYSGDNEKLGIDIVRKALKAPFKQILFNAGIEEYSEILAHIYYEAEEKGMREYDFGDKYEGEPGWEGYNVKTGTYENFFLTGVMDPTKVTRNAIENAASVAGIILTTESVVYIEKTKDENTEDKFGDMSNYM